MTIFVILGIVAIGSSLFVTTFAGKDNVLVLKWMATPECSLFQT